MATKMIDDKDCNKMFTGFEATNSSRVLHFYLSQEIDEPHHYIQMFHQIRTAAAGDTIYVFLNTPGGYVHTGVQMINAFRSSAAKIITVLDGVVASMGTMIFLAGDEFVIHDHGQFMIHNYSGGTWGKEHEQMAQLLSSQKHADGLMRHYYIPFLSDAEFERMKAGEDFWFSSTDVKKRLTRVVKQKQKDAAKPKKSRTATLIPVQSTSTTLDDNGKLSDGDETAPNCSQQN